MKVSHKETKTTEVEVVDDILCNKCGKSCEAAHPGWAGLLEAKVDCGYGSKLGEGNLIVFSLCELCLAKMFATFEIPATVSSNEDARWNPISQPKEIW